VDGGRVCRGDRRVACVRGSLDRPSSSPSIERLSLVHRMEGGAVFGAPQISPDGRRVVYSAEDKDGPVRLWLRNLDGFQAMPMPGTDGFRGHSPFWSPDSKSIAFVSGGKLKRIPAGGGPVQSIADATSFAGGAWSKDGVILFTPDDASGLHQIPEDGGTPRPVTTLPTDAVWAHMWPSFLPDGRRFLFTARAFNRPFDSTDAGIFLGSLDDPRVHRLLPDVSSAIYLEPGFILFARDGVLTAAPFDTASGRITGDAVSLREKVTLETATYLAAFSVSSSGAIALRQALPFEDLIQGRWINRQGVFIGNASDPRTSSSGATAPSGRFVAFGITDPRTRNSDVWVADANGANPRQLAASREWEGYPSWSRDESRVAYTVTSASGAGIKVQDLNGGEPTTLIEATGQTFVQPLSWSPDDGHLLFLRRDTSGRQGDLYLWSFASKSATPFIATLRDEWVGLFCTRWEVGGVYGGGFQHTSGALGHELSRSQRSPAPGDGRHATQLGCRRARDYRALGRQADRHSGHDWNHRSRRRRTSRADRRTDHLRTAHRAHRGSLALSRRRAPRPGERRGGDPIDSRVARSASSESDAGTMSLAVGTRLGPYDIVGPLGAGGMGEVYKARDTRLDREVAIKILPAAYATDAGRLQRFEQEARAAGILNHPNILVIFDVGETDERAPYIVSELLDGETLRERLAGGAFPMRRAVDCALQMARGPAAAHARGIVHRDLKPENLFLTRDGQLKILDFGRAFHRETSAETMTAILKEEVYC